MIPLILSLLALLPQSETTAQGETTVSQNELSASADSVSMPTADLIIAVDTAALPSRRRGTITPVDQDRTRPEKPHLHYYDKHGERLPEPVLFLVEEKDTVVTPRSPYPLYNGVSVSADFLEGIMRLCGQSYCSMGLSASVSLHNWFFPTLDVGIGFADNHPEDGNFRYKAKPTPYIKAGLNYNFLYKSNPDYQVWLGLRAGYSYTNYRIEDITLSNEYWNETQHTAIPDQHAHIWFGEAQVGLRVKIVGPFSIGWKLKYRFRFTSTEPPQSTPWFFPGYGASNPFTADAFLTLTF